MDRKANRHARKLERKAKKRADQSISFGHLTSDSTGASSHGDISERFEVPLEEQLSGIKLPGNLKPTQSTILQDIHEGALPADLDVAAARSVAAPLLRQGAPFDFMASSRLVRLQAAFPQCSSEEVEILFRASMGVSDIAAEALSRAFGPAVHVSSAVEEAQTKATIRIGGGSTSFASATLLRLEQSPAAPGGRPILTTTDRAEASRLASDLQWMVTGAGVSEQFTRERASATAMSTQIRVLAERSGNRSNPDIAKLVSARDGEQAKAARRIFYARNEVLLDVLGGTIPLEAFGGRRETGIHRAGVPGARIVPGAGGGGLLATVDTESESGTDSAAACSDTVRLSRAADLVAISMDLHGLLPAEATCIVPWVLGLLREGMGLKVSVAGAASSSSIRWLACIVGTGHHSLLGKSGGSLPPTVRSILDLHGEAFYEPKGVDGRHGGAIMVRLQRA